MLPTRQLHLRPKRSIEPEIRLRIDSIISEVGRVKDNHCHLLRFC